MGSFCLFFTIPSNASISTLLFIFLYTIFSSLPSQILKFQFWFLYHLLVVLSRPFCSSRILLGPACPKMCSVSSPKHQAIRDPKAVTYQVPVDGPAVFPLRGWVSPQLVDSLPADRSLRPFGAILFQVRGLGVVQSITAAPVHADPNLLLPGLCRMQWDPGLCPSLAEKSGLPAISSLVHPLLERV